MNEPTVIRRLRITPNGGNGYSLPARRLSRNAICAAACCTNSLLRTGRPQRQRADGGRDRGRIDAERKTGMNRSSKVAVKIRENFQEVK